MPYLIVISRNSEKPSVDVSVLSQNLCPYHGKIEKLSVPEASIYHSGLVGTDAQFQLQIPKTHSFEKNSAWGQIQIHNDRLIIETDPMGLLPVWSWATNKFIAIASELKAFHAVKNEKLTYRSDSELLEVRKRSPTESRFLNVERLRPGRKLEIDLNAKTLQETGVFEIDFTSNASLTPGEARAQLKKSLLSSLSDAPKSSICTFLSGGIDSSVATSLLSRKAPEIRSLTLGSEIGNEFKEAREVATHCRTRHVQVETETSELKVRWQKMIWQNEVYDGLTSEILCQLDVLNDEVARIEKQVLTGYGADLLFGGMLRHQAYMSATGVADNPSLIERTSWSLEFNPFSSWAQGVRQFHLYWHPEVLKASLQIPIEMNFDDKTEKVQLRTLAVEENWLPQSLAFRKKIGMTNGTSVHVLLSRVLGLKADYAYNEKTKMALEILKTNKNPTL